MRIRKNGKVIRLTESDLRKIRRQFLNEQEDNYESNISMVEDLLTKLEEVTKFVQLKLGEMHDLESNYGEVYGENTEDDEIVKEIKEKLLELEEWFPN